MMQQSLLGFVTSQGHISKKLVSTWVKGLQVLVLHLMLYHALS